CGASAHFAEVLPQVREYIERYLFDVPISLDDPETVKRLNELTVRARVRDVFRNAILKLEVKEEPLQLTRFFRVSSMEPFHTSEPVYPAKKTVFECLPYPRSSEFEKHFMRYLDEQDEVLAFTKVLVRMPLRIPYHSTEGYLRHYIPDFVVKTGEGYWLLETKGAGWATQTEVKPKAEAAKSWCEKVSELTTQAWSFAQVTEQDFDRFRALPFLKLTKTATQP
ncbi:MAG: hypothetical protein KAX80_09005, partial [Planctomycetes bacterium]|nr:hypothetical protein [Planctomycetota bacterium]